MFEALRWRLTAWYVLAFAVVFIAIGATVFLWVDRRLSRDVDAAMHDVTDPAVAVVAARETASTGSGISSDSSALNELLSNASLGRSADVFVLLLKPDGSIAANPADVPTGGLPDNGSAMRAADHGEDWRSSRIDGHDVRVRTVAIHSADGELRGFVQAGKSLEERDQSLRTLVIVLAVGGLGGLVLATAGGLVVAGIAIRPVRRSFERQREFVADASHELRTPLTVIRTNAEALAASAPEDESVEDIVAESSYMTRLLDDLLTLAVTDHAGVQLTKSRVDLAEVARQAKRGIDSITKDQSLQFTANIDGPLIAEADPERAREAFLIVLDNAAKYTPPGGCITFRARESRRDAMFEVTDNGIGIAPEHLPRLFDRFYRVDKARSRAIGGTGLGLSIAREIVTAHGGTIVVSSAPDRGTTVTIRLPLAQAATDG